MRRTGVAAFIPKDPHAPLASQQTYREALDKGSRCRPASCVAWIETACVGLAPSRHDVNRDCYKFVNCPNAKHCRSCMRLPGSACRPAASLGKTRVVELTGQVIRNHPRT